MTETSAPTARLYVRVSTEKQVREGESLEVQLALLRTRAQAAGFVQITEHIERGVSGSIPLADRPEGANMLAALVPGDVVFVLKLDRLGRSTSDVTATADVLIKAGIGINSADINGDISKDATARLLFDVMASFASHERVRIRERILEAKAHAKAAGDRHVSGTVPFGFSLIRDRFGKGKHGIEPIAHIHALARKLRAQGYSANAAAGAMRAELGEPVSSRAVSRLWSKLESAEA